MYDVKIFIQVMFDQYIRWGRLIQGTGHPEASL